MPKLTVDGIEVGNRVGVPALPGSGRAAVFFCALTYSIMLSGCQKIEGMRNPSLAACEGFLTQSLKSPSSYVRKSFQYFDTPVSPEMLSAATPGGVGSLGILVLKKKDPAIRGILIDYEATNALGASMADKYACYFTMSSLSAEEFEPSLDEQVSKAKTEQLLASVEASKDAIAGDNDMCCLATGFDYASLKAVQAKKVTVH